MIPIQKFTQCGKIVGTTFSRHLQFPAYLQHSFQHTPAHSGVQKELTGFLFFNAIRIFKIHLDPTLIHLWKRVDRLDPTINPFEKERICAEFERMDNDLKEEKKNGKSVRFSLLNVLK